MPLIQVDLDRSLYESSHDAIGRAIHDAQIEALGIPADDRFQVFRPRDRGRAEVRPGLQRRRTETVWCSFRSRRCTCIRSP